MKSPVLTISALIILIAGIVICWFNGNVDILRTTVLTIGAAFAIGGIINLVGITVRRSRREVGALMSLVSWVSGIGGIILGGFLLLFPELVVHYVMYLFGIILLAGGLTLICLMTFGEKGIAFPGYYYILPVIILIDGIVVISADSVYDNPDRLVTFTGVGFILFGISAIMNLTTGAMQRRKAVAAAKEAAKPVAEVPEKAEEHKAE